MISGILFAILACFIWGGIFIIPLFFPEFSPLEVALGRNFFYGVLSVFLFVIQVRTRYPKFVWMKAFQFSIFSTILCYTGTVIASRYASPAICALFFGISPITIACYGNWVQKEISFKVLFIPSLIIILGLCMVNLPSLQITSSPLSYLLGVSAALFSLSSWSWFAVANAAFLKKNPEIPPSHWCTIIGIATLFWVFFMCILFSPFLKAPWQQETSVFLNFVLGCSFLGIFCSWVATLLWNNACLRLPISLAGQLITFETLFGLVFVYLLTQSFPSSLEALGMLTLLCGVLYGIRKFTQASRLPSP